MADKKSTRDSIAAALMQQFTPPPYREGSGVTGYLMDFMMTPTMREEAARLRTPEAMEAEARAQARYQADLRAAQAQAVQRREEMPAEAANVQAYRQRQQAINNDIIQQANPGGGWGLNPLYRMPSRLFADEPPPIGR
jgi:hypothetical protein